jgi:hypothetical protein
MYNQQNCRVVYNGAINGPVSAYTMGNYSLSFAPTLSRAEAPPSRPQAEQSHIPSGKSLCRFQTSIEPTAANTALPMQVLVPRQTVSN